MRFLQPCPSNRTGGRAAARGVETEGDKCSVMGNLIGIDPSWTIEQKKAHLVKEANRANGMANVAANDTERENANKMLENIAYYRKNCLN